MITPMKRRFITCLTCLAFIAVCPAQLFSQIKYTSNGNFGIGTTNPQYLIHILDDDPVLLFESTLNHNNIIRMAEGVNSYFDSEPYPERRFGLIAQELEQVFPNLIAEDENGFKSIDYIGLIPVMIEALKDQQNQINNLTEQIKSLTGSELKSASLANSMDLDIAETATLGQNIPNPFDERTIIKYFIPEIKSYATINVYDLQGSQVKSFKISQTGNGEIIIPSSELGPGMYIFNLIVDDYEVDSKRMVPVSYTHLTLPTKRIV